MSSECPGAAVAEYPSRVAETARAYPHPALEAWSPKSRWLSAVLVLQRPEAGSVQAPRPQPVDGHLFPVSSHRLPHVCLSQDPNLKMTPAILD